MITNFKLFENRISDSMWSKLTMDSSSPTHYLKPNVLKDRNYRSIRTKIKRRTI